MNEKIHKEHTCGRFERLRRQGERLFYIYLKRNFHALNFMLYDNVDILEFYRSWKIASTLLMEMMTQGPWTGGITQPCRAKLIGCSK